MIRFVRLALVIAVVAAALAPASLRAAPPATAGLLDLPPAELAEVLRPQARATTPQFEAELIARIREDLETGRFDRAAALLGLAGEYGGLGTGTFRRRLELERVRLLLKQAAYAEALMAGERLAAAVPDDEPELQAELAAVLANVELFRGDLAAARTRLAIALALVPSVTDPRVWGEVANAAGNVSLTMNRVREALTEYQSALDSFTAAGLPYHQLRVRNNLLNCYLGTDNRKARELADAILEAADRLAFDFGRADAHYNLAQLDLAEGRLAAAQAHADSSVALYARTGNPQLQAGALNLLGQLAAARGELPHATESFTACVALADSIGFRVGALTARKNLGSLHQQRGEYEAAIRAFGEVLREVERTGDRFLEGQARYSLATAYLAVGQTTEAERELAAADRLAADQPGQQARLMLLRADLALRAGDTVVAIKQTTRALNLYREIGEVAGEVTASANLGLMALRSGDRITARARLISAQDRAEEAGLRERVPHLRLLRLLAGFDLSLLASLPAAAREPILRIALREAETGRREADEIGLRDLSFWFHFFEGITWLGLEDTAAAIASLRAGVEILEQLRGGFVTEEYQTGFFADRNAIYRVLVDLLLDAGREAEALEYTERLRARRFLDLLGNRRVALSNPADRALLDKERALQDRLTALRRSIGSSSAGEAPTRAVALAATDELKAAEQEYGELLARIYRENPRLNDLVAVNTLSIPEIQALLDETAVLVSFLVGDERTVVGLVRRDGVRVAIAPAGEARLNELVAAYRGGLARRMPERELRRQAAELYQLLLAPVADSIPAGAILGLAPSGPLHYLPFNGLWDGDSWLIERHALFTVPSASVLRWCLARPPGRGRSLLACGNPVTPLAALPGAAREVAEIAALFPDPRVVTGDAATEAAFKRDAAGRQYVHLATHGELNADQPLLSAVYLTAGEGDDGRLEVHEIFGLDLREAELVTLSACETGLGAIRAGDELVGLTRAFFQAGAPAIVASLWKVSDRSTAVLMQQLYANRERGFSRAESFRRAQLALLRHPLNPGYHHPMAWAPFQLLGDYR